jgi:hypothetical protein
MSVRGGVDESSSGCQSFVVYLLGFRVFEITEIGVSATCFLQSRKIE